MTMLASWVGVDTHGPASAYIISDSRISWNERDNFEHGKKVFAARSYPELFGYAGDVLFPSIVIQQILEMIDNDVLFNRDTPCYQKNEIVFNKLSYELCKYPLQWSAKSFQILHIKFPYDHLLFYFHFSCNFYIRNNSIIIIHILKSIFDRIE